MPNVCTQLHAHSPHIAQIWLTQLGLRWHLDSLDGYLAALLIAFVVHSGRAPLGAPPLTIFQAAIHLLCGDRDRDWLDRKVGYSFTGAVSVTVAESDLNNNARSFFAVSLTHPLLLLPAEGQSDLPPVTVDGSDDVHNDTAESETIDYNCFWRVSETSFMQLRAAARHTWTVLGQLRASPSAATADALFRSLFLTRTSFFERFDMFAQLSIDLSSFFALSIDKMAVAHRQLPHCSLVGLARHIHALLLKALGDRVQDLQLEFVWDGNDRNPSAHGPVHPAAKPKKGAKKQRSDCSPSCRLIIGWILNPDNAARRVDRETAVGEETLDNFDFQAFWGERCTLRRFKDGSIVHAVVWEENSEHHRGVPRGEALVDTILRYVLGRYVGALCGDRGERLISAGSRLESLLPCTGTDSVDLTDESVDPRLSEYGTLCQKLISTIDSLRTKLTSQLKDMPLNIDSLVCSAACARYTSVYPPLPHPFFDSLVELKRQLSGHRVSLVADAIPLTGTFGHSGRWPRDQPEAMTKMLAAFLLAVSDKLQQQFKV